MKQLLTGNEAIARGAHEAGITLAVGYPGTPSTEILENISKNKEIYSEWAPNEKVALEVGIGASIFGARALVTMKHVGVNVAADPLMTFAYTGVNGGLILVAADDPGMHSSQNEQDNRYFAKFAKVPVLEPSDSQEAKDMILIGMEISESYDIPVMMRVTTRVCHSQSIVTLGDIKKQEIRKYEKNPRKNLMVPGYARMRRVDLEQRLQKLREYSENTPLNSIEWRDKSVGVITSGISYQYIKEVLPNASILKLGMTNPLPLNKIQEFAAGVEKLFVVEELEPYIEEQIRILNIKVIGKELFPFTGEFSPELLRGKFVEAGVLAEATNTESYDDMPVLPMRPPVLCAGCPHRGVFYVLKKMKLSVTGDIGCYTLGGLPPLEGLDCCVCMGASIGMAHGMEKAIPEMRGRSVAVIGDSTFMHSGVTGLINIAYNHGNSTVIILDNRTTAMTGHQDHPSTGQTLMGEKTLEVDLEALCRAIGISRVQVVNPLNLKQVEEAIKEEVAAPGPSVIICRQPCVLLSKEKLSAPVEAVPDACNACKACLRLSCPALSMKDDQIQVDAIACNGCGVCVQVCKFGALAKGGNVDA